MSASDEWTDWHLTPRGWERGDSQVDFAGITRREVPSDRVFTSRFREFASSVYAGLRTDHRVIWQDPDENAVQALRERFGDPPHSL